MLTEERLRDALRDATTPLELNEDVAWQRTWLEVARAPARRAGRYTVAFAAVAAVALALLGWQVLVRGTGARTAVRSGRGTPTTEAGGVPATAFDALQPGDVVPPSVFVDAANTLAAARGNVTGSVTVSSTPQQTSDSGGTFAVDRDGAYRFTDPVTTSLGLADGSTVVRNLQLRAVDVVLPGNPTVLGPDDVVVPNDFVDHALRPGAWVASGLATQGNLTITFVHRGQLIRRVVDEFSVQFASSATDSSAGWDLYLDTDTGALLAYTVHFAAGAAINSQTITITNFDDHALSLDNETVPLPAGDALNAVVNNTSGAHAITLTVPTGATVASVLDQVRTAGGATR
jgi:hypothetical protein